MIKCLYCGADAVLVSGCEIYPHRNDLSHLKFWECRPCDAYVGCHGKSDGILLGTLAKPKLRALRHKVHAIFDSFWRGEHKTMKRTEAYKWLAAELSIPADKCHIAMFNQEMCHKAILSCNRLRGHANAD